jgi:hypothetical protein
MAVAAPPLAVTTCFATAGKMCIAQCKLLSSICDSSPWAGLKLHTGVEAECPPRS